MKVEFFSYSAGVNCSVELDEKTYKELVEKYNNLKPILKNQFSDAYNYIQAVCSFNC